MIAKYRKTQSGTPPVESGRSREIQPAEAWQNCLLGLLNVESTVLGNSTDQLADTELSRAVAANNWPCAIQTNHTSCKSVLIWRKFADSAPPQCRIVVVGEKQALLRRE